jgi:diketogulonate reductase-like aldo/keto reductase
MTMNVTLNNGVQIPALGFGVLQTPPDVTADAVGTALATGYRLIDTAAAYGNEREVGQAIRHSGLARDEVFVTTKLWNSQHGRDAATAALDKSLGRLGLDAVDLYLIHWPLPAQGLAPETWQALVDARANGKARSIGVSNFRIEDLEEIIEATGVVPAANQIELHPRMQQRELRAFHAEHGIATIAWSPLGQGRLLRDEAIVRIADKTGRTPAQVIIRWHVQLGNVVIPKSVTPSRIEENLDVDFALDQDAMAEIEELDESSRIGPDPATFALGAS